MKLSSQRNLEELKAVLKDPGAAGPDPVYWVFSEVSKKWVNATLIAPGSYNGEYPKTFGHYHSSDTNETYRLIEGEGVLVLQKKHLEEGKWIEDMVDEVFLIKAQPGDEIVITPEYGHAWSNAGKLPLISFDDWKSGHSPTDYEVVEKLKGLAYYLVEKDGKPKAIANPNYRHLPEPVWTTAAEFAARRPF